MPTISFLFKDFQQLLGKRMPVEEFENILLLYAKAEVESYDKRTDEIAVKLDDTNLPYLWCPEGLARLFKGILGQQKGMPKLKVSNSRYKILVEDSVRNVRPYITAFVAKGKRIDDYTLKQLVQMQEKFCESYGRRRQKVSIGMYAYKKITFPVHYKAVDPASARFVPLDFNKEMNLNQILQQHPKGQQYSWILKGFSAYPLLLDDKGEALSFPPIINSSSTGRLEIGDNELLFEATGTDEESVNLAASIFAQNLADRGFEIFSATIAYKGRNVITPLLKPEKVKITPEMVEQGTGLKLNNPQLKQLLERAGYDFVGSYASVPHYRADIMHPVDVIEDVAIAYGYDKIADEPLSSYTIGMPVDSAPAINLLRKTIIGMGFQEIFSHILTDKNSLITGVGAVELENFMSETYSAVRNSVLPQLLDVLAKNKHVDYPQKIFEEGIVAAREGSRISEWHSVAFITAHSKADFTEMKQYVTALLAAAAAKFEILPAEHPAFIKGRAGSIVVNKRSVGIIGEISPSVLSKWGIETPAAALEINLNLLLSL
ncbi:phenylalanine--tRNA ligase subunit beta [Candidatus Woesearchaeota archaeon]|nr:phenylalanine--tRNA ligase subunit beta [Candidatus Woesearchaeota archaeon]